MATKKEKMLALVRTVAIYARKSQVEVADSEDKEEVEKKELEKHISVMTKLCEERNWRYVTYPEVGSGESIDDRPEMTKLLRDVEDGMYDAVVVMDYDRLGRGSGTDQDRIRMAFKRSETLVVEAGQFNVLNMSELRDEEWVEMKGFVARLEHRAIKRRFKDGKLSALQNGRWAHGAAPYGYIFDTNTRKLRPHPEESKIYQELMVEKYLEGDSLSQIAWKLNQMKIPSPRGKLWTERAVGYILKNEVYLGIVIFNKSSGSRDKRLSVNHMPYKKHSKDEWVYVKNQHPALISQETFNKVNEKIKSKSKNKRYNGKSNNAFTHLIKCSKCGKSMSIQRTKQNGYLIRKCENCGMKGGETELVQDAIIDTVKELKDRLLHYKELHDKETEKAKSLKRIRDLEEKLDKFEQMIERIEEAYEEGLYDINKTKKKKDDISQKIAETETILKREKLRTNSFSEITNEQRIERIDQFLDDIDKSKNLSELNRIYKTIISSIEWKREEKNQVEVKINFL